MSNMPEENVKKLDRLLSLLDPENALTKSDFVESFKKVVELILKIQARQEHAIQKLFAEHSRLAGERKQEYDSNFKEIKSQVNDLFVGDQLKRMEGETKASFEKRQKEINELVDKRLEEADYRVSLLKPIKGDRGDKGDTGPMPTENLELMRSEEHTSEL